MRRGRFDPERAAFKSDDSTPGVFEQVIPICDSSFAPLGERGSSARRLGGDTRESSLPRFGASERLARDFDEERSSLADSRNATREEKGFAAPFDGYARRHSDELGFKHGPCRDDAVAANPSLDDLAIFD